MRYLIISCFFLIVNCASYPKKQELILQNTTLNTITNSYFSDVNQDYVYKAAIDVYDNHFGGLLIVKKIDQGNHRVVFTSEMGKKLFDFSITKTDFKVNYILEQLDKKLLINILKRDFTALVQENSLVNKSFTIENNQVFQTSILNKKHYYYVSKQLNKIVRTGSLKEKVQFLFSDISNNIAHNISIIHSNIKLEITLKSIY
ncbi:hypothetical protein BZARG_2029 [Bizionia argentinensis JUB59]|uniref:DUF4292 domain-containing protein n=1 Tax=Bizionia argentinensis JUB59 TaxID=1046627 RepID=G2EF95_9FLAO|nr:hypothetical protein [Bizionia argentinensis]EGV42896.1 hypothetical protein BZARG_2029 [Bizionia argentinensis JUB59]